MNVINKECTIKISVIMPVYNAEEYVSDAIESVLSSTLSDFELICVNDGSTDNSLNILREYSKKDDRIIVLEQQNSGAGVARNYAMSQAQGEYVTFLDADDTLEIFALEKMYLSAIKNDADVVVSNVLLFDEITKQKCNSNSLINKYLSNTEVFSPKDIAPFLFNFTVAAPPGKFVKTELIKDNKLEFLALKRSEDFYFIYRSLYKAKRIAIVNDSTYCKRNVPTSLENTKAIDPLVFYDAIKEVDNITKEDGVYDLYKQSIINSNVIRFEYNLWKLKNDEQSFNQVLQLLIKVYYSELGIGFYPAAFYYDKKRYFYLIERILEHYNNCDLDLRSIYYDDNTIEYLSEQLETYKYSKEESVRLTSDIKNLEKKYSNTIRLYNDVLNSFSYKIGRIITFIPRRIKMLIKK